MKLLLGIAISQALIGVSAGGPAELSGDEVLARLEAENQRRQVLLKEYSGSRQYTLQNLRFGKQAAVGVVMRYRQLEGQHYTVMTRSGSEKLNSVIDKVLASEASQSLPRENARHQITAANYRVRLLRTEAAAGRKCYVLELSPRMKHRFLIEGKAWVDAGSYAVVRIEGQFAASISLLVGAPRISEDFIEVQGFWLPGHVRSVTSSFLLGPTELDILFSNYQLDQTPAPLAMKGSFDADSISGRCRPRSSREAEVGDIRPQSGNLQEPDADANHDHGIQDRFDAGRHRDIPVDQVQPHSNDDQHHYNVQ